MMKAIVTALALGAGVFLVAPQPVSAAPLGVTGASVPLAANVEKVHGRRHGHHHRHHWHRHHYGHRHHWRRHYYSGPAFGFSFGPSYGYGHRHHFHNHHRRWNHW